MTNQAAKYRVNEIDLLRFFAALGVVFYHYAFRGYAAHDMTVMPYLALAPISKYGYLGVHLFFIISGFVILMTASRGSLRGFFVSRLVRLYPAFWACCTITALFILAIGAPRYGVELGQYLINLTMMNEFFDVPSVDGVYWTLFVELRFYALVCVILLLRRIHQAQALLILWLAASLVLQVKPSYSLGLLLIVDYSAFFIAGATFFMVWSQGFSLIRFAMLVVAWGLGLFQTLGELTDIEKVFHTKMDAYLVAGIVTMFFLVMLGVSLKRTGFFGRKRWMLAGAMTYPLYLLHQKIGFMIFNLFYPQINAHLIFWGTIVGVLAAAYAVHVHVERKLSAPMKAALDRVLGGAQLRRQ